MSVYASHLPKSWWLQVLFSWQLGTKTLRIAPTYLYSTSYAVCWKLAPAYALLVVAPFCPQSPHRHAILSLVRQVCWCWQGNLDKSLLPCGACIAPVSPLNLDLLHKSDKVVFPPPFWEYYAGSNTLAITTICQHEQVKAAESNLSQS